MRYGTDLGNGPLPPASTRARSGRCRTAGLCPGDVLTAMAGPGRLPGSPGGLDLEPARFADVLATARVVDDTVRPRLLTCDAGHGDAAGDDGPGAYK